MIDLYKYVKKIPFLGASTCRLIVARGETLILFGFPNTDDIRHQLDEMLFKFLDLQQCFSFLQDSKMMVGHNLF